MNTAVVALAAVALLAMPASANDKGKERAEKRETAVTETLNARPAVCTFADGEQVSVHYQRSADREEELRTGKPWPARGSVFLFTPAALTIGGSTIPVGAFSLYIIPGRDDWTLIVNKNVTEGANYDETQDLLRTPIKTGELDQPAPEFTVSFAHVAPRQCNMRLYYGRTGTWAEFTERQ